MAVDTRSVFPQEDGFITATTAQASQVRNTYRNEQLVGGNVIDDANASIEAANTFQSIASVAGNIEGIGNYARGGQD